MSHQVIADQSIGSKGGQHQAYMRSLQFSFSAMLATALSIIIVSLSGFTFLADLNMLQTWVEFGPYLILLLAALSVSTAIELDMMKPFLQWLKSARATAAPLAACGAFMIIGPALTVLNKHIMQSRSFHYPLSLSALGLLAPTILARTAVGSGIVEVQAAAREALNGKNYARVVLPIAFAKTIALATGNAVYLHLSLGFIQMLKAFMPAIVLFVAIIAEVEAPMRVVVWCILVIVTGTLIQVTGELQATPMGLSLMLVSCFAEATSQVMGQKLMHNLKLSVIESMYFLSLPSLGLLLLSAAVMEWPSVFEEKGNLVVLQYPLELLAAAALGVAVNFLGFFVVQTTSSVSLTILNVVRCIGLVVFAMLIYGETHSLLQLSGYAVSLAGCAAYTFFQRDHYRAVAAQAWMEEQLRCAHAMISQSSLICPESDAAIPKKVSGLVMDIEEGGLYPLV